MIIISQDKNAIVNFDNVSEIRAQYDGTIVTFNNTYDPRYYSSDILGKYETEERAKEVLQEIVKTYVLTEQYKVEDERTLIKLMMEGILLYEMPKE